MSKPTRAARRAVLREVHDKWIAATNNKAFSDWLRAELEHVGVSVARPKPARRTTTDRTVSMERA